MGAFSAYLLLCTALLWLLESKTWTTSRNRDISTNMFVLFLRLLLLLKIQTNNLRLSDAASTPLSCAHSIEVSGGGSDDGSFLFCRGECGGGFAAASGLALEIGNLSGIMIVSIFLVCPPLPLWASLTNWIFSYNNWLPNPQSHLILAAETRHPPSSPPYGSILLLYVGPESHISVGYR